MLLRNIILFPVPPLSSSAHPKLRASCIKCRSALSGQSLWSPSKWASRSTCRTAHSLPSMPPSKRSTTLDYGSRLRSRFLAVRRRLSSSIAKCKKSKPTFPRISQFGIIGRFGGSCAGFVVTVLNAASAASLELVIFHALSADIFISSLWASFSEARSPRQAEGWPAVRIRLRRGPR
jgi:hypothetical protein